MPVERQEIAQMEPRAKLVTFNNGNGTLEALDALVDERQSGIRVEVSEMVAKVNQ